ncbi:hypothetical protein GCM10022409_42850 [Hymenobacter glaciei]|uniref:DUF4844 domain-containing protein n=1 Tax=Hymenobacter glaciei TaxID=877209 RepID=A0ABP7USP0_9BACT
MKRFCCSLLLSCLAFLSHAQAPTRPGSSLVVGRLEDFIEATKHVAEPNASLKSQVEARPELNRLLVIAAFDFVQITRTAPSREAYLDAMDRGLARLDALMMTPGDRREIANFYIDLMDIVGIDSSDGRLDAFAARQPASPLKASN